MRRRGGIAAVFAACTLLLAQRAWAQAQTFDQWFETRVNAVADAANVGQNGKGAERQRETPAVSDRSTSLVDTTSATDFVSAAISLATVPPSASTGTQAAGAQSVTASLYALLAGLNGKAPTDPVFYRNHVDARRASFTVGSAASDVKIDNTDKSAVVAGVKFLVWNGRELYRAKNQKTLAALQKALSARMVVDAVVKDQVQRILFRAAHATDGFNADGTMKALLFAQSFSAANYAATVSAAGPRALKDVDAEIAKAIRTYLDYQQQLEDAYDSIQNGGQFAVSYTANVRQAAGFDKHRVEVVYDYGLSPRVLWTANGSWDYVDKKALGHESSARFATEFSGDLTAPSGPWSRLPIRLSGSAQATWLADKTVTKEFQAKLTIPISAGLDLPVVYRYVDPTPQSPGGSEAKVGFSVDLSRLAQAVN